MSTATPFWLRLAKEVGTPKTMLFRRRADVRFPGVLGVGARCAVACPPGRKGILFEPDPDSNVCDGALFPFRRIASGSGVRRPRAGHGRKHDPGGEIVMQGTCPPTTPNGRYYIVRLPKWITVELNFRSRYRLWVRRNTPCSPKKFQIQGSP
jgi:hypothetical protein